MGGCMKRLANKFSSLSTILLIKCLIFKINIKLKVLNIITRIKKMPRDSSAFLRDWSTQLRNNIGDIQVSLRTPSPLQKLREDIIRLLFLKDSSVITDEEIIKAYKLLAKEGVFCEPASAASVAGLIKNKNRIKKESTIVCVLTGNGLKDPDCAIKNNDAIFQKNVEPSLKNITKILGY